MPIVDESKQNKGVNNNTRNKQMAIDMEYYNRLNHLRFKSPYLGAKYQQRVIPVRTLNGVQDVFEDNRGTIKQGGHTHSKLYNYSNKNRTHPIKGAYAREVDSWNNNNYNTWSKQLSQAWGNQDLSKDHYDYRKYYNDQPIVAWLQLSSILAHNWNRYIPAGHFPDKGASGTYKTKTHPTYPDLGDKSWSKDNKIYFLSKDQFMNPKSDESLDYTMDYLGSDYDYNNGGTKVVYDGANVLPTVYVTNTKGSGFNLKPNKNNNGYIYFDRKD